MIRTKYYKIEGVGGIADIPAALRDVARRIEEGEHLNVLGSPAEFITWNIIPLLESDVLHDAEQLLKDNQRN